MPRETTAGRWCVLFFFFSLTFFFVYFLGTRDDDIFSLFPGEERALLFESIDDADRKNDFTLSLSFS